MIPRTLSASSLTVFQQCPARWVDQYLNRMPDDDPKLAADLGSTVHLALEYYVTIVYIKQEQAPSWNVLAGLYEISFQEIFGVQKAEQPDLYEDGLDMCARWFKRHDIQHVGRIISTETKSSFMLNTSAGPIPFNYIWDRCDEVAPGHIRVVDYKTQRMGYGPDKIRQLPQARLYALAAAIQFKGEVQEIEVQMDLLRHEPVSAFFTRDDNTTTYRWLQRLAEEIIATDENNAPYKLNENCRFCPIKAKCPRLHESVKHGSIHSVDPEAAPLVLAEIQNRTKALEAYGAELEKVILAYAENNDMIAWENDEYEVKITGQRRRDIDSSRLAQIIGSDKMKQYGKVRLGDIDRMIKNGELTQEQVKKIQAIMSYKISDPTVKVTPKIAYEEI